VKIEQTGRDQKPRVQHQRGECGRVGLGLGRAIEQPPRACHRIKPGQQQRNCIDGPARHLMRQRSVSQRAAGDRLDHRYRAGENVKPGGRRNRGDQLCERHGEK